MRPSSSPAPKHWTLSAALIVKDEARHIEEWIAYHHLIGVEHVYVYDNNSSDDLRQVLAPYITRGLVTYLFWPHFPGQFDAYAHACQTLAGQTEWLCLFDVDEFLVLRDVPDLRAHLMALPFDQVLVRWRMFGHSGHHDPQDGLTTDTYVHCSDGLSHVVKAIVRPAAVKQASVHFCRTARRRTVAADAEPAREGWAIRTRTGPQPLELNHYYTRSYTEYLHKMARGDANRGEERPAESFKRWDFSHVEPGLRTFAPAIRAFVAAVRRLPTTALRSASLSGGHRTIAAPTLGNWTDSVLKQAQDIANGIDPQAECQFMKASTGSFLAVTRPSPALEAALRDHLATAFRKLTAEAGLVPIGRVEAPAATTAPRPRHTFDWDTSFPLPGYVMAVAAIGPTPTIQTVRIRAVSQQGQDEVQMVAMIGVAPDTLHLTVAVLEEPCRPTGLEVRWIDQFAVAGAATIDLALIA